MREKWFKKKKQREFEKLLNNLKESDDFIDYQQVHNSALICLGYFNSVVDIKSLKSSYCLTLSKAATRI